MNPRIAPAPSLFVKGINSSEEIDNRLFNTFMYEPKSTSVHDNMLNDLTSLSEEEESSDSSNKMSVIGTGRKAAKMCPVLSRKRETKPLKIDLDTDEITTKAKKSTSKSCNKRSTEAANQDTAEKKSLYKTELCRNWEETHRCRYGMKCQYAHGTADLREIDRHPKYKTQKCRTFHQTGSCPYGARCTFRHFNLPDDALEMKNLDKEEEEKKQQQQHQEKKLQESIHAAKREDACAAFSSENQKLAQQNWFMDNRHTVPPLAGLGDIRKSLMTNQQAFDPEDSLLPSNAESLLPHQLLFDLESPDEDVDQPRRCPLRNYVNLPSFSNFQAPHYLPSNYQAQQQTDSNCKTFFRPWLF